GRLADHPGAPPGVRVDEVTDGGDDARRIPAQLTHIDQSRRGVSLPEPTAEPVQLPRGESHHRRLALIETLLDEACDSVEELAFRGVVERLVSEPVRFGHRPPAPARGYHARPAAARRVLGKASLGICDRE